MRQWTEIEFERISINTKLSNRTLAACRDVLVDGMSGKDAAERHKMFPAQISRALGVLRKNREEVLTPTDKQEYDLKKLLAIRAVQELVGEGIEINEPRAGLVYSGPVILNAHGFVVQKIGRSAVIHDLDKLQDLAQVKGDVEIQYPANGVQAARVKDLSAVKETKGVER
ncbi:MAG TPA: hypothetical protein VJ654_12815 [Noviherbaspirillum sp.]|nr:hypothetical protein [Noviherbaspirillum sp.]